MHGVSQIVSHTLSFMLSLVALSALLGGFLIYKNNFEQQSYTEVYSQIGEEVRSQVNSLDRLAKSIDYIPQPGETVTLANFSLHVPDTVSGKNYRIILYDNNITVSGITEISKQISTSATTSGSAQPPAVIELRRQYSTIRIGFEVRDFIVVVD